MSAPRALACVLGSMDLVRPLGLAHIRLLFISRWRAALARAFRFVVPDATLVEDLVDKERRVDPVAERPGELGLRFPLVLKPLTRRPASWDPVAGGAKALRVDTPPWCTPT